MAIESAFRLLVVRLGAMGDILHALPAVTALRQEHPDWTIDWVVEPNWRALLTADGVHRRVLGADSPRPLVDRLHYAATKKWRQDPLSRQTRGELAILLRRLRAGRYDAVLDVQGSLRSGLVSRLTGCPLRIGDDQPREHAARLFYTQRVFTTREHVIEQGLELASAVAGENLRHARPILPFDFTAEAWAEKLLPSNGSQVVLINPGAGWGAKCWPIERYAQVAHELVNQGKRIVVNAGPGEEHLAGAIVRQTGGKAVAVSCSVGELIALTRRVSLVIAGDTGPLHLACALGKPVVAIFGPTDPGRNGPYATRYRVLRSPDSRRDHKRRAEPEAGLLTITPQQVLTAAAEVLYSGQAS